MTSDKARGKDLSSSGSDKPNRNHRCTIVRKKKTYQNPTLRHTSLAIKIFCHLRFLAEPGGLLANA